MKMHKNFGIDRVLEPKGSLPVTSWKLDNSGLVGAKELKVNLKRIAFERENFYQLCSICEYDESLLRERILKIVNGNSGNVLYNLGSGKGHSLTDVIQCLKKVLGKEPDVEFKEGRAVDVPVNVLDISRFERDFGELAPISLEEGIKKLLYFYQANEK